MKLLNVFTVLLLFAALSYASVTAPFIGDTTDFVISNNKAYSSTDYAYAIVSPFVYDYHSMQAPPEIPYVVEVCNQDKGTITVNSICGTFELAMELFGGITKNG